MKPQNTHRLFFAITLKRAEARAPAKAMRGPNRMLTSARNRCFICEMAQAQNELLTDLLKAVSRSFYLTIRVLPKSIRPQIGLGYLLARTTDTVADTEIVPVEQRLKLLQALRERILGTNSTPVDFGEL